MPQQIINNETPGLLFSKFDLSEKLKKALLDAKFETATPIQQSCIPIGLAGHDLIGCAQTGTGKTAAFLLPLISHLEKNPNRTALIMAPTREIVHQISDATRIFLKYLPDMKVVTIIGGARMSSQLMGLARRPRIIVGTPGRLNDLIARGKIDLRNCQNLILDEADRMLDMGFAPQIDQIIKHVPTQRQTWMFSATMAGPVEKLAKTYLKSPQIISVGEKETAPDKLNQKVIVTSMDKKENDLMDELNLRKGSVLIFAQTQRRVEKLGYRLKDFGFSAEMIHGGRTQGQRFRALKLFKDGEVNILVATDVASRGLDIGNICHVINYDLPSNPEDFLHRIGRTARNGKDGDALTLVLPNEGEDFSKIKKYFKNCEIVGHLPEYSRGGGGGGGGFRKKRYGNSSSSNSGGGGRRFGSSSGGSRSGSRSNSSSGGSRSGSRFGGAKSSPSGSSNSSGGSRFGSGKAPSSRPARY